MDSSPHNRRRHTRSVVVHVPDHFTLGDPFALAKTFARATPSHAQVVAATNNHAAHSSHAISSETDCVSTGVSCKSDADCSPCGAMDAPGLGGKIRFRCIPPPASSRMGDASYSNNNKNGGVCGLRTSHQHPPCPASFAFLQPYSIGGVVEWKCLSKYPQLVEAPSGRLRCCRGGRFVHERTGAPYVAGYHDPSECRCVNCRPGTVSDGAYECVRDPCFPGVSSSRATFLAEGAPRAEFAKDLYQSAHVAAVSANAKATAQAQLPGFPPPRMPGGAGCDCPPGYVSCPGPAFSGLSTAELLAVCPRAMRANVSVCVRDPCDPGWLRVPLQEVPNTRGKGKVPVYTHAHDALQGPFAKFDLYRGRCVLTQLGRDRGLKVVFGDPSSGRFPAPQRGHVVKGDFHLCGGSEKLAPVRFPWLNPEEWWREWVDRANPVSGVAYDNFFNALKTDYLELRRRYVY